MNDINDQDLPSQSNPRSNPVRFVLHWAIKLIVLFVLALRAALRPRLVRYGLVLLLVIGLVGWRTLGPNPPGLSAQPLQTGAASGALSSVPANNQLPPSSVVERYIQQEATFNATGMYGLLSDRMKSTLQGTNDQENLQQLQDALDTAKASGRHYTGATYVGGMPLENGENVYFYVLKVETPSGSTSVPYIYVVGPDNMIDSIQ